MMDAMITICYWFRYNTYSSYDYFKRFNRFTASNPVNYNYLSHVIEVKGRLS